MLFQRYLNSYYLYRLLLILFFLLSTNIVIVGTYIQDRWMIIGGILGILCTSIITMLVMISSSRPPIQENQPHQPHVSIRNPLYEN